MPGGTTHLAWLSRTAPNGRTGFGVALQASEDGVVWSAPKEVLVTNAACQLPLTATATRDGAFVFLLGDSRSVAADICSPDATQAVVVRKPISFFE